MRPVGTAPRNSTLRIIRFILSTSTRSAPKSQLTTYGLQTWRVPKSPIREAAEAWRGIVTVRHFALVYAFGLLSWTLAGLNNGLGFIPAEASNAQLIAAGIIPAVGTSVTYILARALWRLPLWTSGLLTVHRPAWIRVIQGILIVLTLGSIVVMFTGSGLDNDNINLTGVYLLPVFVSLNVFVVPPNALQRLIYNFFAWLLLVIVGLWLFGAYIFWVYDRLPQALGGGNPECVLINVDGSRLSRETSKALDLSIVDDQSQAKSVEVQVVFRGGDKLFFRTPEGSASGGGALVELRGDIIVATRSCADTN